MYDDDRMGLTAGTVIGVLLVVWLFWGIVGIAKADAAIRAEQVAQIRQYRYDVADVKVFLNSFRYDMDDFLNSKTLRKQYESWAAGESSMADRKAELVSQDARSAKNAANAAVAMSAASMVMTASRPAVRVGR
jgi:hypothetical protein